MKKMYKYSAAPVITAVIMIFIFCVYHLFPFSNNTIAWCDMRQQVVPLMVNFKNILDGKEGFFINMQNAGGMNFAGIFFYFFSSPFSFIIKFIDSYNMSLFMNILVILKMMCASFTANYFFQNKFKNLHWSMCVLYSVMYAFCGYTMMFYQIISWADMLWLFPIILLSINMLIEKGNVLFYIIVLSVAIIQNFYLSYNIVIFLILFFGVYCFFESEKEKMKNNIFLFSFSSIISYLITSPVWIITLFQYSESARASDVFKNVSDSAFFSPLYTTLAFLFCTAIIFSSLPFIILNIKNLNVNSKKTFILFIFSIIPIFIEPINKMWQTGSYQAFPVRYGYIPIFFGLMLSAEFLNDININNIKVKNKKIALISLCVFGMVFIFSFISMMVFFTDDLSSYTKTLWVTKHSFIYILILFLLSFMCYFIAIYFLKYQYISRNIFLVFICLICLGEAIYNTSIYITTNSFDSNIYKTTLDLGNKIHDDAFYRVKLNKKYFPVNMIGAMGYPSLNHFTSFTCEDYMYSMKKLGYSSYWMEINSTGGTKFTDTLFSNKYIVKSNIDTDETDEIIYRNNAYSITKSDISLPLGLRIPENINLQESLPSGTRFDLQQDLYEKTFNTKDPLFDKINPIKMSNLKYNEDVSGYSLSKLDPSLPSVLYYDLNIDSKQLVYFDCFDNASNLIKEIINDSFSVFVNGKIIDISYPSQRNSGILNLGSFEHEEVHIEVLLKKDVICKSFGVFSLDETKLYKNIYNLNTVNIKTSGNKIYGNCVANHGEKLYLSIPYSKGYSATINGENVPIQKVNGAFMSIPLQNQNNEIEIKYLPLWFTQSIFISALGVVFSILLVYFNKKILEYPLISSITLYCFLSLFIIVILSIYILPVIFNVLI